MTYTWYREPMTAGFEVATAHAYEVKRLRGRPGFVLARFTALCGYQRQTHEVEPASFGHCPACVALLQEQGPVHALS